MNKFTIKSSYGLTGDQPEAVDALVDGVAARTPLSDAARRHGLAARPSPWRTSSRRRQRPTLVIAHNKTLAAQLCAEFREFFPDNAVGVLRQLLRLLPARGLHARTDTYIEKDSTINDEIDRLRHSATEPLFERRDVVIVASVVSCIYGFGSPEEYLENMVLLQVGRRRRSRRTVLRKLVDMQYERNDIDLGARQVPGARRHRRDLARRTRTPPCASSSSATRSSASSKSTR